MFGVQISVLAAVFVGMAMLIFFLILGLNMGVGFAAMHGPYEACQMIRIKMIDCQAIEVSP